jgi:hypothetical protein
VKYIARGPGYVLHLTDDGTVYARPILASDKDKARFFALKLRNTSNAMHAVGSGSLPSKSSYYTGLDQSKWLTGIPNFSEVQFQNAYPGIHLVCQGVHGKLEYDFKVEPGAKPEVIAIEIIGNKRLRVMSDGRLAVGSNERGLRLRRPTAYQELGASRQNVPVSYTLHKRIFSFAIGDYDRRKVLFIDPVLDYTQSLESTPTSSGERQWQNRISSRYGIDFSIPYNDDRYRSRRKTGGMHHNNILGE